MKKNGYFVNRVMIKRPYVRDEWLEEAIASPLEVSVQPDGRVRHWIFVKEFQKYLRVVTLDDNETVLNAFFDRGYKEKTQ